MQILSRKTLFFLIMRITLLPGLACRATASCSETDPIVEFKINLKLISPLSYASKIQWSKFIIYE